MSPRVTFSRLCYYINIRNSCYCQWGTSALFWVSALYNAIICLFHKLILIHDLHMCTRWGQPHVIESFPSCPSCTHGLVNWTLRHTFMNYDDVTTLFLPFQKTIHNVAFWHTCVINVRESWNIPMEWETLALIIRL